jgi:hypothetical protein
MQYEQLCMILWLYSSNILEVKSVVSYKILRQMLSKGFYLRTNTSASSESYVLILLQLSFQKWDPRKSTIFC